MNVTLIYKISIGKTEGIKPLRQHRRGWEYNAGSYFFYGWCYIPENCKMERNNIEGNTFVEDHVIHKIIYRSMIELEMP